MSDLKRGEHEFFPVDPSPGGVRTLIENPPHSPAVMDRSAIDLLIERVERLEDQVRCLTEALAARV